jgi:hypothetical protein
MLQPVIHITKGDLYDGINQIRRTNPKFWMPCCRCGKMHASDSRFDPTVRPCFRCRRLALSEGVTTVYNDSDLPRQIAEGLRRDKEALRLPEDVKESVWQKIITERPDLEHAVFEWPDPPWWRRLWNWIRGMK